MSIRVALSHRTTYRYDRLIHLGPQVVRLRPAPHNRTPINSYSIRVRPEGHFLNWVQDPHGNFLARVVFPEKVRSFEVQIDLIADLEAYNPFDFFLEPEAEEFPFRYAPELTEELEPYLDVGEPTPRLIEFVESVDMRKRRTVDFLVDVNRALRERIDYVIRMEPGVQTPEETLEIGRGSCRDSAWLLVQTLRRLGLAARFASGYLIQLTPDQRPLEGPPGPLADFTDLHAWCECYVPGAGWIGLDPTSGLLTAEGHIPLACSPKPQSAAPITGLLDECKTEFEFDMCVERIVDLPRVTKPYTDDQWSAIDELGAAVDRDLCAQDVRLTMGGEPTFVGIDHPDAPEWNLEALGAEKHRLGDNLVRRLRDVWQPGAVLHHGQGKWYPGEQLPRWALACYFRRDGVALWKAPELLARTGHDHGHTVDDAERFVLALAAKLGLELHGAQVAYEDTWYYLWKERRLPINVDPLDARLDDPLERDRLAGVFRRGLDAKVGWVLPLAHAGPGGGWVSGRWFFREEHCFLIPGDSPMGFRLPLDSLPWAVPQDRDFIELDPGVERAPLPHAFAFPLRPKPAHPTVVRQLRQWYPPESGHDQAEGSGARPGTTVADPFAAPMHLESAAGIVRTALCVEPREGILRVFLPPIASLDAWCELIAAIELTASELQLPLQLEGYPPPRDPRIDVFKVTPDPGVLEVNVPPTSSWEEHREQTRQLYEIAREERLTTEKFDLDGRHIGSGGGNHVVLGGQTLFDSPFLRRPDVLRSLIAFWHNHPSLSYLFAGQFIGPTSQAPRVDEARNDAVYELELAFAQLPEPGAHCPPWLADRLLRNLLVDMTGNTHRAEFCIDKLYSPDGLAGRLGLLELRAFEMPPHSRMASVQALLVRALIAAFWREPYTTPLVKWGTSLHDRFLLPYFVRQDLQDALHETQRLGYELPYEWFQPHYEFRFPLYGTLERDALHLEIRGALEPWHVLGEEPGAGGQARYVDSSLERVQVLARGFTPGRHLACCNGALLPGHATGVKGEFVSGVRYRAWQPPLALHPTIGVHHPLRFDIYDDWNGRAVAGCTYHVVHPGGRANEERPVNAVAAESRRIARFEHAGHVQGRYEVVRAGVNPDFPLTLDLRLLSSRLSR